MLCIVVILFNCLFMMCFVVLICELVVLRNGGMLAVVLFCWLDLTCGFVCG